MHQLGCANDRCAVDVADCLVTEAHPEDGDLAGKCRNGLAEDARVLRTTRSRRQQHRIGLQRNGLCDGHRIIVTGPRKLRGRPLDSRDLRSGMALIAAALAADGESRVAPLETVERGYAQLVDRLKGLGASVTRLP